MPPHLPLGEVEIDVLWNAALVFSVVNFGVHSYGLKNGGVEGSTSDSAVQAHQGAEGQWVLKL